ncbi:unnamed protein product [Acanthoscelides obtectus]|uniref:Integrin beta n=1 Tax=Acanthoscelides obtectus TaxID=200917 RepID=A0A9P0PYI0_ACAOB|nr:unnamed protein product [Acanthoscelides obtectus]CAK1651236.1 Integrin beta-nu [Acanthoscelides obtectus]
MHLLKLYISYTTITLYILLGLGYFCKASDPCSNDTIQNLCWQQETCEECLQIHECCHYCYDEVYPIGRRRCNTMNNLFDCNADKLERNFQSGVDIEQNDEYTDKIQIRPQNVKVRLRYMEPENVTFSYKPAKNYALDLYYLGDLSVSMKDNLETLKKIGKQLTESLTNLTKNYRLAYGSFLDKTAMPFYFTDAQRYENPCLNSEYNCETGYLFKHKLDFTPDMEKFIQKVSDSKTTANIDDLDGALDAILQILVCGKRVGWNPDTRKIIVLATDSLLHTAGDGLLAGAVRKPTEECLLDENGEHRRPLIYDYPDIGQIHDLLRNRKVNIIFAVKKPEKLKYYNRLRKELLRDFAFSGELVADEHIIDLIEKGYHNFARQVNFFANLTEHPHIDIKFFGDCEGIGFNETNLCYNVENNEINFKVQITLIERPAKIGANNSWDTIFIEEKNIQERIEVSLEYEKPCECENYIKPDNTICENGGTFVCGYCNCPQGWKGDTCELRCETEDDYDSCRQLKDGHVSTICHMHGECNCGKCECDYPYLGTYCQFKCPIGENRQICSGKNHGTCFEGKCLCKSEYTGKDCSCSTSTSNCHLPDSPEMCNSNGKCHCNKCECNQAYSDKFCEVNGSNNTICEIYKPYVEEAATSEKYKFQRNGVDIYVDVVGDATQDDDAACRTEAYSGSNFCVITFGYSSNDVNSVHLKARISCYKTAGFKMMTSFVSIVAAVVIGGILFILIWKIRIYHQERVEYKKFMSESKMPEQTNPLYKNPITTYRNPLLGKPFNDESGGFRTHSPTQKSASENEAESIGLLNKKKEFSLYENSSTPSSPQK